MWCIIRFHILSARASVTIWRHIVTASDHPFGIQTKKKNVAIVNHLFVAHMRRIIAHVFHIFYGDLYTHVNMRIRRKKYGVGSFVFCLQHTHHTVFIEPAGERYKIKATRHLAIYYFQIISHYSIYFNRILI